MSGTKVKAEKGYEIRHKKGCPAHQNKKATECRCTPSHRAVVYNKVLGKNQHPGGWDEDLSKVKRYRRDYENAMEDGVLPEQGPMKFAAAVTTFLDGMRDGSIRNAKGGKYKPSCCRSYTGALENHAVPILGNRTLVELTRQRLQVFVDDLGAKCGDATVIVTFTAVRTLYRWASKRGIVVVNPCREVDTPKATKRKVVAKATGTEGEMVIRTAPQVLSMVHALNGKDMAIFATAALGGLRRGELQFLRVLNVDFEENVIRVRGGYDSCEGDITTKTDAGERDVPMNRRLRTILLRYVDSLGADYPPEGRAFPGRFSGSCFSADPFLKRTAKVWEAAGIEPLMLHEGRHQFVSLMIASGANIKQVSKMAGHSSIVVTLDRYGHLLPGSEAEAAAKMDTFLDDALGEAA